MHACSCAGELGVSGSEDGHLRVWDALSGTLVRDLTAVSICMCYAYAGGMTMLLECDIPFVT